MRLASCLTLGALATSIAACGAGGNTNTGGGTCTPSLAAAITIAGGGVSPSAVCVLPNGTVTFTNRDTVAHDIQSGTACPALNLGPIGPSLSKAATFATAQVCAFHDAANATNAAFQGTVVVTAAVVTGGGY